jgi:phospholipid/cholesterol/gamma-HCH transport system substrate-binding protein
MSEKDDLPPAPPSRGHLREVWVGLFVIVGVAGVLLTLFVMTSPATFRGRYILTTNVADAGGIRRGDPVQMRGVNIGRVQRFTISKAGVAIRLEIEGEYRIPRDSKVELKSSGLLGGLSATVDPGGSSEFARDGDVLEGRTGGGVMDMAHSLAGQAETALDRVKGLLSEKTIGNVEESSARLKQLLGELSATVTEEQTELRRLVKSLQATAGKMEKATADDELEHTLKNIDSLAKEAEKAAKSLERSTSALDTILARIEKGEGSLGKLSKDPALYDNLNTTVQNLNGATSDLRSLIQDLQKNPKKYVKLSLF